MTKICADAYMLCWLQLDSIHPSHKLMHGIILSNVGAYTLKLIR
jgi:hypothetical protein